MFEEQMTFQALRNWGDFRLEPYMHDKDERMAQLDYLLTGMMNWSYPQLNNNLNTVIEDEKRIRFEVAVRSIQGGLPVQYALGTAAFYGREFSVDRRVLIPRQETEEIVEWILKANGKGTDLTVLDLGTGSGAIGLTLADQRPNWQVTLSDISHDALEVAKANAEKFNLDVKFVESDLFAKIDGKFDLIVSNPPYIGEAEKDVMDESVLIYEPELALFADDEGYALYKQIATELLDHLNPKGVAYFEIGYLQGPTLLGVFGELPDVAVELRQDLSGHDRMLRVSKQN
ncbi:MAG: peptide chain release factor N(5)-glutamine methyltransferase [Lactobacillaceae bacterium]|jgi:release factor glutamine methyltransferase|nr:peptide chain release factor N(5)-glutamine methyltransferase [Lactobacillaceae bacterium]